MAMQTGHGFWIDYKEESSFDVPPTTSGATRFRANGGSGMEQVRSEIESGEIRPDLQEPEMRLGSGRTEGSYPADISVGTFDPLWQALFRSTYVAATAITVDGGGTLTSFTVTDTNTVTLQGSGSLLTLGLRVGDVARFSNMSTAANNSIDLRIKSVGANTFDVHGAPLTSQGADTAATLTILKKLKNLDTPVLRSFYIEQHHQTIDQSLVFGGSRLAGARIVGGPDGMATIDWRFVGASMLELGTGASPYYVTTTPSAASALVFADSAISLGGSDVTKLTQFDLDINLNVGTVPTIGSFTPPGVFDNRQSLRGSIAGIREDLSRITAYRNETEYELHILLRRGSDCISLFLPLLKLTRVSAPYGGDNAMIETSTFRTRKKQGFSATGYDDTTWTLCTSAA